MFLRGQIIDLINGQPLPSRRQNRTEETGEKNTERVFVCQRMEYETRNERQWKEAEEECEMRKSPLSLMRKWFWALELFSVALSFHQKPMPTDEPFLPWLNKSEFDDCLWTMRAYSKWLADQSKWLCVGLYIDIIDFSTTMSMSSFTISSAASHFLNSLTSFNSALGLVAAGETESERKNRVKLCCIKCDSVKYVTMNNIALSTRAHTVRIGYQCSHRWLIITYSQSKTSCFGFHSTYIILLIRGWCKIIMRLKSTYPMVRPWLWCGTVRCQAVCVCVCFVLNEESWIEKEIITRMAWKHAHMERRSSSETDRWHTLGYETNMNRTRMVEQSSFAQEVEQLSLIGPMAIIRFSYRLTGRLLGMHRHQHIHMEIMLEAVSIPVRLLLLRCGGRWIHRCLRDFNRATQKSEENNENKVKWSQVWHYFVETSVYRRPQNKVVKYTNKLSFSFCARAPLSLLHIH